MEIKKKKEKLILSLEWTRVNKQMKSKKKNVAYFKKIWVDNNIKDLSPDSNPKWLHHPPRCSNCHCIFRSI